MLMYSDETSGWMELTCDNQGAGIIQCHALHGVRNLLEMFVAYAFIRSQNSGQLVCYLVVLFFGFYIGYILYNVVADDCI